jgi:hypothetical protein
MGGVSYCGVNPGRDQRCSMEAPPNFQLDRGQTLLPGVIGSPEKVPPSAVHFHTF